MLRRRLGAEHSLEKQAAKLEDAYKSLRLLKEIEEVRELEKEGVSCCRVVEECEIVLQQSVASRDGQGI